MPLDKNTYCHLDPDLNQKVIRRDNGWRPLFGQTSSAQSHLEYNGVEIGDIFLFFGWFKDTIIENECLKFNPLDKNGKHIIFGYMQIGDIIKTTKEEHRIDDWMKYHPHYTNETRGLSNKNTIYVGRDNLSWNQQIRGAGTFKLDDSLILTKKDCKRSHWNLPQIFKNGTITYQSNENWVEDYFKSANRGQEFIIKDNNEVTNWAKTLTEKNYKVI